MTQNNFIPRKFKNTKTNDIVDFETIINGSNISVILGEPASGKTSQLTELNNINNEATFIKPIHIRKEKRKSENILLFDSIDEALIDNPDIKDELLLYIEENKNKKFVLTCRYHEWKEKFEKELKKLDKTLNVYEILPLIDDEINYLIRKDDITNFWNFIEKNHLKPLLKNIMIIFYLVNHFKNYSNKNITYTEIYEKIIKEYITKVAEDREEENTNIDLNKLILIASSLATYMTLNKKLSIPSLELKKIANECYKIDDTPLLADDLKAILSTTLFKKKENNFNFFHKSIQEYLTAYFINYKKLDAQTIENIFAHDLSFYEEFEEVIIYLTNMNSKLFNEFVEFEPFIFRRHPYLDEEQQKKLFRSILNKKYLIKEQYYLGDNSLTRFDKIKNLGKFLRENIDVKKLDRQLYMYILSILKVNYQKELDEFLISYLWEELVLIHREKECKNILKFLLDSYLYNYELYKFLKDKDLFETGLFEFDLLKFFLEKKEITEEDFLYLIKYIPVESLREIVLLLEEHGLYIWFKHIEDNHKNKPFNVDYIGWVIYGLLNNYSSQEILSRISLFLDKHKINLDYMQYFFRNNRTTRIPTQTHFNYESFISDLFELYFNSNNLSTYYPLLYILEVNENDIETLLTKYSFEDYTEKYKLLIAIPNFFTKEREAYLKEEQKNYNNPIPSKWTNDTDRFLIPKQVEEQTVKSEEDINEVLNNFIETYKVEEISISKYIDSVPLKDQWIYIGSDNSNLFQNKINQEKLKELIIIYYRKQDEVDIQWLWGLLKEVILQELAQSNNNEIMNLAKKYLKRLYDSRPKKEIDYKNILDNYKNEKDIFFNYDKLRDDLIEISLTETKSRNAISKESEDETNDRFRNALHYKNYNVTDQSRGGESSSGINAGERDLVVCNSKGIDESIIEALQIKEYNGKPESFSKKLKIHYEKLVKRYDTVGNRVNFVLVYSKVKNFDDLWTKYSEYDGFDNFVDTKDEHSQKDNVHVGISEDEKMQIYHIFINFYSNN